MMKINVSIYEAVSSEGQLLTLPIPQTCTNDGGINSACDYLSCQSH